jgi:hypothetical protein
VLLTDNVDFEETCYVQDHFIRTEGTRYVTGYFPSYMCYVARLSSRYILLRAHFLRRSCSLESLSSSTLMLARLHFRSWSIIFAESKSDGAFLTGNG